MVNHEKIGKELKQKAKSKGDFVTVNFENVDDLLKSLSYFFYRKHHEWIAICFINKNFKCHHIWFNKGPNYTSVTLGLTPFDIVDYAEEFDCKHILIVHNHPASGKMHEKHFTRYENIIANKHLQRKILGFSDQDNTMAEDYDLYLQENHLKLTKVVFVAGKYKVSTTHRDQEVVNNIRKNKYLFGGLIVNLEENESSGCLVIPLIIMGILLSIMFF